MANIVISGDSSGSVTLSAPAVSGTTVLTLPTTSGTLIVSGGAQTIEFADGTVSAPSITNSGDTNTGIYFPAADTIAFTEGGVESMRIDSSGNVGIGTSSPANKLDVAGIITASGSPSNPTSTTVSFYNGSGVGSTISGYQFAVRTGGTPAEAFRINESGNVGIGTSSPTTKLSVYGAAGTAYITMSDATLGASYGAQIRGYGVGGSGGYLDLGVLDAGTFTRAIRVTEQSNSILFSTSSGNTERMRITSAGLSIFRTTNNAAGTALFIEGLNATTVSTSATSILGVGSDWGGLVIVTGNNAGLIFTDLLFMATSGINVVSTVTISGSPAGRTYTQSSGILRLAMGSGTYAVSAVQMRGSL